MQLVDNALTFFPKDDLRLSFEPLKFFTILQARRVQKIFNVYRGQALVWPMSLNRVVSGN